MLRQTLLLDADDTLWENNVVFERVIEDYLGWLAHPTLDRAALRAVLDDVERANTAAHGYGSRVFLRTLADTVARLRERPASAAERAEIETLAAALADHRVELVPGVADVLTALGSRHTLRLVTKGEPAEQQAKIDASGLAGHFVGTHIVREKDEGTYRRLIDALALDPDRTWMIGNSPRSDIAPARAAGLRAVLVPNPHTWVLEQADLPADDGVLTLPRLADLLDHF